MSSPDSMIVVATRQSASPRRNTSIVSSSSRSSIRPCASANRTPGHSPRSALRDLGQRLDPIVEEEHLAASLDLALDRALHQPLVVGADERADRPASLRRGLDHRDIAQPGEAHLERPGNRCRRQRDDVHLELELAQQLLLPHPEALLLVDDQQAELLRPDVAGEQAVSADQDVDLPVGVVREHRAVLGGPSQAGDHLDAIREIRQPLAERPEVLLGENRRRHQHHHLA